MNCDFCSRIKETKFTTIEYKGNAHYEFDSMSLSFNLCAQCIGENLTSVKNFKKAVA